jgi:hypothetical protein
VRVKTDARPVRAGRSIADGMRDVLQPPFRALIAIGVLVDLVSSSFGTTIGDDAIVPWAVLFCIAVYMQLALTLAAGSPDPEPSADGWIKGAFRRRSFLRYLVTGILTVAIIVLAGVGGLIVGGVIAGGWISLAQSAAAIERRMPLSALRRSIELGRAALPALSIIFFLLVGLPTVLVQAGYYFGWDAKVGAVWFGVTAFSVVLDGAGTIALTRAFVALGGDHTPPLDRMDPKSQ